MVQLIIPTRVLVVELMLDNCKWCFSAKWTILALIFHVWITDSIIGHYLQKGSNTLDS